MNELFTGTGVALVTPIKEDLSLDLEALGALVRHVTEGGVDYLVVLGTTAETATLSPEEKDIIRNVVREENAGRLPLVIGIGGNDTLGVARQLGSTPLEGYQAVLSVSPYYNRPTQEGIYRHFSVLASHCPLPILAYNVPARTGSNMLPETTLRLARECPGIIGIKEACGEMQQIGRLIDEAPEGFLVLSGDDFTAVPTVLRGGAGVISVLGQGVPGPFSGMMRLAASGASKDAQAQAGTLTLLMESIFKEGNPAGIKALLHRLGVCGPYVRLPLVEASEALALELARNLDALQATLAAGR
ncbi:4-hydroxy-tetrahydrodipicolinate synthase [Robiginitalea sediminis]|uniref:4-hydroxy-tetrahydrodipicolinate synthase n=1 Tax=Robiginitalea sediminis TaxID=1982593 RepID=UPI000B4AC00F|nr:4-hydroxy-tetrahydrodipicolinate synthase [Robiginitalea sediminis]